MNYRFADGGDKIAAFERGMSDEGAHRTFETPGITAYVVDETFLVAVSVSFRSLVIVTKLRLYGKQHTGWDAVDEFLMEQAHTFGAGIISDRSVR